MATVMLAWEQGGGLGHLLPLKPIAEGLAGQGHRVVAVLCDLSRVRHVFGDSVTTFFQAPLHLRNARDIAQPITFAHILHNAGFGDQGELSTMVEAWRALYQVVEPDMIVFDHCPAGLLAARGLPVKRVLIGTGFTCPPDDDPLPALRPVKSAGVDKLRADEQRILGVMNRVLDDIGQPPLSHLMQLYAQVDSTLLTTFRELDHYPHRPGTAQYWGNWTQPESLAPQWPAGKGKRVYAYLKHNQALPGQLAVLRQAQQPTIAYVDGLTDQLRQQFNTATLRLEDRPLNLQQVGRECDLAILNGGHGASITMLLAGKPILQMPIYLV